MHIIIKAEDSKLKDLEARNALVKKFMYDRRNKDSECAFTKNGIITWEIDLPNTALVNEVLREMEEEGIEVTKQKSTKAHRKASKKYADKFDQVSILLPKGTKEKIKILTQKENLTDFISESIKKNLKNMRSQSFTFARDRMNKVITEADTLQKDSEDKMEVVRYLEEEYRKVMSDLEIAVKGEQDFEDYIEKVLGEEAVEKFAEHTSAKLFSEQEVNNLKAALDFGFTNHDFDAIGNISPAGEPVEEDRESSLDWLIDASKDDYIYASHVLLTVYTRCDDMEKAVTDLLGEEAFDRLVSKGSYWKERLYRMLRNSTKSELKRQKYFLQYLTDTGVFADEEDSEDDDMMGWKPLTEKPMPFQYVVALLSNGTQKALKFMRSDKKGKKDAWRSMTRDWSDMVVAWKEMEDGVNDKETDKD